MMRVGHFEIRCGVVWEIWEGHTLKYKRETFDEALELADDLLEEDREREEASQYGTGSRARPERRGILGGSRL